MLTSGLKQMKLTRLALPILHVKYRDKVLQVIAFSAGLDRAAGEGLKHLIQGIGAISGLKIPCRAEVVRSNFVPRGLSGVLRFVCLFVFMLAWFKDPRFLSARGFTSKAEASPAESDDAAASSQFFDSSVRHLLVHRFRCSCHPLGVIL